MTTEMYNVYTTFQMKNDYSQTLENLCYNTNL